MTIFKILFLYKIKEIVAFYYHELINVGNSFGSVIVVHGGDRKYVSSQSLGVWVCAILIHV